jgi:nicotinate dehydrogenase subunit A
VAFLEAQAAQCGYCTNGMIMTAKALLDRNSKPDAAAIKEALSASKRLHPMHHRRDNRRCAKIVGRS